MSTEDEVKVGHVCGPAGICHVCGPAGMKEEDEEEEESLGGTSDELFWEKYESGYYSDDLWEPLPDEVQEEYTDEDGSVWVMRGVFVDMVSSSGGGCEGWMWSTEGTMWLDKFGFCWLKRDQ